MFCSLFTLIMCTTLCILPFTLVALSWLLLAPLIKLSLISPLRRRLATPSLYQPGHTSLYASFLAVAPTPLPLP